jgi:hypothetical protein
VPLANSIRLVVAVMAMLALTSLLPVSTSAQVSIGISVGFAPPELPVYAQPICPGEGYIWTPGYWAWDPEDEDYYWVPGTWVLAPEVGFLWTPGYWGWGGSAFEFYEGYWGPRIGFYGGINYGYGYFGRGYEGGRWDGGHFYYNRTVNRRRQVQSASEPWCEQPCYEQLKPATRHRSIGYEPCGEQCQPAQLRSSQ